MTSAPARLPLQPLPVMTTLPQTREAATANVLRKAIPEDPENKENIPPGPREVVEPDNRSLRCSDDDDSDDELPDYDDDLSDCSNEDRINWTALRSHAKRTAVSRLRKWAAQKYTSYFLKITHKDTSLHHTLRVLPLASYEEALEVLSLVSDCVEGELPFRPCPIASTRGFTDAVEVVLGDHLLQPSPTATEEDTAKGRYVRLPKCKCALCNCDPYDMRGPWREVVVPIVARLLCRAEELEETAEEFAEAVVRDVIADPYRLRSWKSPGEAEKQMEPPCWPLEEDEHSVCEDSVSDRRSKFQPASKRPRHSAGSVPYSDVTEVILRDSAVELAS